MVAVVKPVVVVRAMATAAVVLVTMGASASASTTRVTVRTSTESTNTAAYSRGDRVCMVGGPVGIATACVRVDRGRRQPEPLPTLLSRPLLHYALSVVCLSIVGGTTAVEGIARNTVREQGRDEDIVDVFAYPV